MGNEGFDEIVQLRKSRVFPQRMKAFMKEVKSKIKSEQNMTK